MKVEIWSDIMCPFCYIGKRHFESALEQFEHAGDVEIEWKSFQLDPTIGSGIKQNVYQYLAERKGMTEEQSVQMHQHVTQMAGEAGLDYHFEKAVVANSFKAHRLIQLAKKKQLGDAAEEALFKAYFTEGKDVADDVTLAAIGSSIGLHEKEVSEYLAGNQGAAEVEKEITEAQEIGVRGVPFFVLDRKYAVSGAQPVETFLDALQKSHNEWKSRQPQIVVTEGAGPSCDVQTGECS